MTYLEALIIAIVEGLTEFLPISSTAHMRITESILGLSETDSFTKLFTIAIQLGAILAVVFFYAKKFFDFSKINFYIKLIIAVIPALVLGKLFGDIIDAALEKLWVMSIILILGGILFLFIEKLFKNETIFEEEKITNFTSFKIGLFQCLAIFFPGLSRSAATILGGMSLGLSRQVAAEFSFFLAVPTMFAATIYKIYEFVKEKGSISNEEIKLLAFGNIIAFIVALLAIKLFIEMVKKFGFKPWGWYRIIAGSVVLLLIYFKIIQ